MCPLEQYSVCSRPRHLVFTKYVDVRYLRLNGITEYIIKKNVRSNDLDTNLRCLIRFGKCQILKLVERTKKTHINSLRVHSYVLENFVPTFSYDNKIVYRIHILIKQKKKQTRFFFIFVHKCLLNNQTLVNSLVFNWLTFGWFFSFIFRSIRLLVSETKSVVRTRCYVKFNNLPNYISVRLKHDRNKINETLS